MAHQGYCWTSTRRTIEVSKPFAAYAEGVGVLAASGLSEELVERYLKLHRCRESRCCLSRLMAFLRARGVVPGVEQVADPHRSPILSEYLEFLARHRGTGTGTAKEHRRHVQAFLEELGADESPEAVGRLEPGVVSRFVTRRAEVLGPAARKSLCASIRCFLRFLLLRGYMSRDLVSGVPVIPTFKLARLPRAASTEDIAKVLGAVDRSTPTGRRDYAILLVLSVYGIRSGQICGLRLEDLDWRRELLRLRAAKGGRDVLLPLYPAVGEALVDYLRHGRPRSTLRQVFLRVRAPIAPLSSSVSVIIRGHARRAGVTGRVNAHAWRHACAARMLARGASLKTICDVLGHRSIETTFIYTKINIHELRQAALDWPWAAS
jgi:site-specific recombinase XerD